VEKPRIFLIGVAHVLNMGERVREEIISIAPRAVCVELDRGRLYALRHPDEISSKGLPIYMRFLARLQRKIGESYGVQAGEEMLQAIKAAEILRIPALLVDDDAYIAVRRMFKEMSIREKLRFIGAFIPWPSRKKVNLDDELKKYEGNKRAYMEEFGRYFPTAKRILIDERNQHMAERIFNAGMKYGRVVAVLGDAHLEGIKELLAKKGAEVEVIHMKDLRRTVLKVNFSYRHA